MGRIKELINSFIQPNKQNKSFKTLLAESGITGEEAAMLINTMEGPISWTGYSEKEENSQNKKRISRDAKIKSNEIIKAKTTEQKYQNNEEKER